MKGVYELVLVEWVDSEGWEEGVGLEEGHPSPILHPPSPSIHPYPVTPLVSITTFTLPIVFPRPHFLLMGGGVKGCVDMGG